MRRLPLIALSSLWFSANATAGVDLGGNLPTELRQTLSSSVRPALHGQLKAVRWIPPHGRAVTQPVHLPLQDALTLQAPAGDWTDVELIFDGEPRLGGRSLPLSSLVLALDEPLLTAGEPVVLSLDLEGLRGLELARLSTAELAAAVRDGLCARVSPLSED